MTDVMVDIETTHTNPHLGGIIQLAAIKFNLDELTVGEHFDRCPMLLPFRGWSDGTREFWRKHPAVLRSIIERQEPAHDVFLDFSNWISKDAPAGGFRFWAKPTTFDWSFVASHFEQLNMPMPFHYRIARDVNSFIAGLRGNAEHPEISEHDVPFHGAVHNALHDTAHQIDMLFFEKRRHVKAELIS